MLMASNRPTSHHHPMKAFHGLVGLFVALLLLRRAVATQFKVGGASGWTVPSDANNALNQWAERNRFLIGDSLLFSYQPDKDSVLKVDKDGYDNCNVDSGTPFKDGNTIVTLDKSGPHYFISGVKDNCLKNEKLVAVVMAGRNGSKESTAPPPSVPPSPPPPALSPTNSTVSGTPPPSSAAGSPENNPSIAPAGEESPPPPPPPGNGASSKFISFIACVGVLGSSLLFVL